MRLKKRQLRQRHLWFAVWNQETATSEYAIWSQPQTKVSSR
jgi:hypothetical protein